MLKVEAIAAEKLYPVSKGRPAENFVLLDKIRIFRASFLSLAHVGCRKIPGSDGPKFAIVL